MDAQPPDIDQLLLRAEQGDRTACQQRLERHRPRLRRMVALRPDRRLSARLDPFDRVQKSLAEVARRGTRWRWGPTGSRRLDRGRNGG